MRRVALLLCCLLLPHLATAERGRTPVIFAGWPSQAETEAKKRERGGQDPDFFYEAATLRPGTLGISAGLGFPYLLVEGGVGVSDATDLRFGVRALYGLMSQLHLSFRARVLGDRERFALALRAEGSYAFYQAQGVAAALSGTRDAGAAFGIVASVRKDAAVFFVEASMDLAMDLDPQPQALGGIPPPVQLVANLPLHAGVELKISRAFHLSSFIGADLHFASKNRLGEPAVMPYVAVTLDVLH